MLHFIRTPVIKCESKLGQFLNKTHFKKSVTVDTTTRKWKEMRAKAISMRVAMDELGHFWDKIGSLSDANC